MSLEILVTYTIFAFFYITSPGPAILLAIVNGIRNGMKIVIISSLGNITGLALLSVASVLGLGLLMRTSTLLFATIKLIGAAYFIYLGIKFLRSRSSLSIDMIDTVLPVEDGYSMVVFFRSFFSCSDKPETHLIFHGHFPSIFRYQSK